MKVFEEIKDTSAQGGAIPFFIGAMLAVIIALSVAWPVMDSAIYDGESAASGSLTLTGNTSCGERVNVTSTSGILVPMIVNITEGCPQVPYGSLNISIGLGGNGTAFSATNISGTINANSTLSAEMAATNSSSGVVTLTYNTIGTPGNAVLTTETLANASWTGTSLLGGAYNNIHNMSSAAQTLTDQLPLFLVLVLLMVFVKALI